jgi:microcystin-dependent protein
MTQPFLGQITLFAGNFAPRNTAQSNGQLLSIQQNSALFSLLGTFYGGNGTTNFALPDLRGRLPLNQGNGPGLTPRVIGEVAGEESVTILQTSTPTHTHSFHMTTAAASNSVPGANLPSTLASPFTGYYVKDANKTGSAITYSPLMVGGMGGSQSHENRMPAMALTIIIALTGIFPSRN